MAETKKKTVEATETVVAEKPKKVKKEEVKDFETPVMPLRRLTREEKMAWFLGK